MKQAGIYARVSDDKLKEDGERRQDVDRQVDNLQPAALAWVKAQNEKLVTRGLAAEWSEEILIFKDDGKSAFKEDYNSRPDFIKLMNEIRGNHLHRIWIESLDRWSRRIVDGLTTMKVASLENNCTIVSTMEGEADITTSQGWMRTAFGFMMAEWASRDKAEKTKDGMERRRNDKRKICSSCGIVHMGRHLQTCQCSKCRKTRKRKGGVENLQEEMEGKSG